MICQKCKKEFSDKPAMSRRDNSEICPMCGHREALEDAVNSGAMTQEEADEIIEVLKQTR